MQAPKHPHCPSPRPNADPDPHSYHRFTFNEPMPVESLTQSVCDLALKFGEVTSTLTPTLTLTHTLAHTLAQTQTQTSTPTPAPPLPLTQAGEEGAMSRPFGVALLVAGWDDHGPALYHTDPSGTHTRVQRC